jgi:EAL domain-containing protein (putative c-di-GMP-specific phosphodiesterase class I)
MNLQQLIEHYKIKIYFQPIVSTINRQIIGFEALTRGFDENKTISPIVIFSHVKELNLTFEFDKYVRALAICKFKRYYQQNKELLLFLNFESSLIDNNVPLESFEFAKVCEQQNIAPSNLVLEIREDKIENSELLEQFCQFYKQKGFNIALDDFGIGGSTFDRLSLVKPDIVKIDRSIIHNIQNNFIHSEILKAISKMCNKIGAVVLAEGVEEEQEILKCIKNDISIFQGFYFAKPQDDVKNSFSSVDNKLHTISNLNAKMLKEHQEKKKKLFKTTDKYSNYVIKKIKTLNLENFSSQAIKAFLHQEIQLEAMYLIDYHNAKQVGETLLSGNIKKFYMPAKHGDSHYLKEYFYITKTSKEQSFLSQKYISNATGNMCRTFAKKFTHENEEYILCLDILV